MATIIQKKRLANEVKLLAKQPLHYCTAYPDESNPLIWYFLIKGQRGTDYHTGEKNSEGKYVGGDGGEYIGKIVHSPKYPAQPPDYYMLTPSGRFGIGGKICNTNSSYHKDQWSSTWNILSILIAFYSVMLDDNESGIGHIKDTKKNRKRMAEESIAYNKRNNAAIYAKFDRTHLRDDAPVIVKEEQTEQTEQTENVKEQETQFAVATPVAIPVAEPVPELTAPVAQVVLEPKIAIDNDHDDDENNNPKVKKTRKYTKKAKK